VRGKREKGGNLNGGKRAHLRTMLMVRSIGNPKGGLSSGGGPKIGKKRGRSRVLKRLKWRRRWIELFKVSVGERDLRGKVPVLSKNATILDKG